MGYSSIHAPCPRWGRHRRLWTTFVRLFGHDALDEEGRRLLRRYSPQYHAHASMPPILMIHGTNERLWDQGVAFAETLREVGADHELHRLNGAPHGMENWEDHPEWVGYKQKLVEWLEQKLDSPGSTHQP